MSCITSTPTARDYQLAHERVLETLWLDADNDNVQFFPDDLGVNLGTLMASVGEPFHILPAPLIVPASHNLKASISLVKTVAASADNTPLVGASTDYGLQLHAILVRTKRTS